MKNKLRTLLFIVFLCLLLYPFLQYFTTEGFTENSPYGQWELVLRQSYNSQYNKSPFDGNTSVNLDALYDSYGNITKPNYYNSKLYSDYDFSDNRLLKLNYYAEYEDSTPTGTIKWMQNKDATNVSIVSGGPDVFMGLNQSTDGSYAFVDSDNNFILGLSQSYLDSRTDVSYIPYSNKLNGIANDYEKVELFLWNPRPNDKNTFNGNYKDLTISKVDMNDTNNKNFWNKSENVSGTSSDKEDRYSYCFGKLKCNDNDYTPIKNSDGTYKPYCDSDSSMNPVYCEGSALYNTNSSSLNPVTIGTLSYDMMGKYATGISDEEYFNLFRGLTTPYNEDYIDPEISGNDVIVYDSEHSKFVKNNICNYLNNSNLINGTNLQEECEETRYSGKTDDSSDDTSSNKCIADYGDKIDSRYKDYVCEKNESCVGYECGVKFGNCTPSLL